MATDEISSRIVAVKELDKFVTVIAEISIIGNIDDVAFDDHRLTAGQLNSNLSSAWVPGIIGGSDDVSATQRLPECGSAHFTELGYARRAGHRLWICHSARP